MIGPTFATGFATADAGEASAATHGTWRDEWARRLFGLDAVPADATDVRFVFERPLPGWGWFVVLLCCGLIAWWAYSRLRGPVGGRTALGFVRALLLAFIALLLAGPAIRIARETVEKDWVLVLVDRSRSMLIRDERDARGMPVPRESAIGAALAGARPELEKLERERSVVWLGFAGGAFDLLAPGSTAPPSADELPPPEGDRTRIDDALQQAMQRAAARRVAGIVLLTDGRTSAPPSRSTLKKLQAMSIPVFPVALGSADAAGDLSISKVESPRRAFLRDEVPIRVEVERGTADASQEGARVRLVDVVTGEELASAPVGEFEGSEPTRDVTLTVRPEVEGQRDWRVELDAGPLDLVAENNVRTVRVELVDRPLRVLYVDGYPRWEYRYLKNLLVREPSIDSSILLLSADRDFAQEGNMPLARLPRTAEEFAPFDAIILGDVPSSFFAPEQLEAIRDQVANRGTGLLWIGGERATPRTWENSPLVDLLPLRPPFTLAATDGPVNAVPTPAASQLGVLRLGEGEDWPRELSESGIGWSRLEWSQSIPQDQVKPTAEVLALGMPAGEEASPGERAPSPLILAMKYGAGETIYVATDEFWRWRYGRGERYTEQVWLPLVRMLGREALAGGGEGATLRAAPARVPLGQTVRIELATSDALPSSDAHGGASVPVAIATVDGAPAGDLELSPSGRAGVFAASFAPDAIGRFVARVEGGAAAGAEVTFECERPDDELRRSATDHELLADLAKETGGRVLAPDELAGIDELLRRRHVVTEQATVESLWDGPLSLVVLVLLASAEWLGRRWLRLS